MPAQDGDYVQLDLQRHRRRRGGRRAARRRNISHEVGSKQLLPGLDEVLVGLVAGADATFTTQLVGGDFAGRDADVAVTVRTVKEKQLPELDDEFAQLASEFDTLDELRGDLQRAARPGEEGRADLRRPGQGPQAARRGRRHPGAGGRRQATRSSSRKQAMTDQLERIGASLEDYLASEEKTEEQIDAELTEAATEGVRIQLLLDTIADAEDVQVSDDEFGHEIVHRAQRARMQPQQYYDQLVQSGAAASVFGDVRRGKALAFVMEQRHDEGHRRATR